MAFTYGFYNSVDHDRTYDAEQLSSIFDGIITDGVYATYKDALRVVVSTDGTAVVIKPGRAWFKHTWSYVDSDYPLAVLAAHAAYNRIDALVLDINGDTQYRENKIMWVQGTAASTPTKPALTNIDSQKHWQYPLAYVTRRSNSSTIADGDVEPVIGTSACPYVTGVVEGVDIDSWFTYWNGQYQQFSSNFDTWMNDQEYIWTQWFTSIEAGYEEQRIILTEWIRQYTSSLDDDPANRLFKQVMDIYEKHNVLAGENLMFNPYVDGLEKTSNGITFKVNYEGRNDGVFDRYQGYSSNTSVGYKHQDKVPYGAIEISGVATGKATFDILMPTWEELGRYWDGWYSSPAKLAADPDYKYTDLLSLGLNYRLTLMPWVNNAESFNRDYEYTTDYEPFSKVHMDLLVCCPEDKGYIYSDGKSATREWVKAISIPYWTSGKNREDDDIMHSPSYSVDLTPMESPSSGKLKTVKRFIIEEPKDLLEDFSHSLGGLNSYWGLRITIDSGADLSRSSYKSMVVVPVIQYLPSYTNLQPEIGLNVVNDDDYATPYISSYDSLRASYFPMERAYSLRKLTSMIDSVTQYIEKSITLNSSASTNLVFTDPRIKTTSYLDLYCDDPTVSYVSTGSSNGTVTYSIQQVVSSKTVTFRLYIR